MTTIKTTALDGFNYYLDTTSEDGGNQCVGCVTSVNDKAGMCERLPDCRGGVWKRMESEKVSI